MRSALPRRPSSRPSPTSSTIPASARSPSSSGTASTGRPPDRAASSAIGRRDGQGRDQGGRGRVMEDDPGVGRAATPGPSWPRRAGGRRTAKADNAAPGAIGSSRPSTAASVETGTRVASAAPDRRTDRQSSPRRPEPFDRVVPGGQGTGARRLRGRIGQPVLIASRRGETARAPSAIAGRSGRSESRTPCPSTTTPASPDRYGRDTVSHSDSQRAMTAQGGTSSARRGSQEHRDRVQLLLRRRLAAASPAGPARRTAGRARTAPRSAAGPARSP